MIEKCTANNKDSCRDSTWGGSGEALRESFPEETKLTANLEKRFYDGKWKGKNNCTQNQANYVSIQLYLCHGSMRDC